MEQGISLLSEDTLRWSDAYLVGFKPMDDTHREFVECVQAMQCSPDSVLLHALLTLRSHCEAHFGKEQQWMDSTEVPSRECHADEHMAVMQSFDEVLDLLRDQPCPRHSAVARSPADELARWFPGHADHMDSALSHWMSDRRFGGKPVVLRRTVTGRPLLPG